jgi:hypothetical protein
VTATYETRPVGIPGETDVIARPGVARQLDSWNLTPEQVATHPFLVGRISQERPDRYHITSYAQQVFQRSDWKQNNAAYRRSYEDALAWLVAECNNVLERL